MDVECTVEDDTDSQIKWSKGRVLKLISLYKERRCLYDNSMRASREDRRIAITDIAKELGVSDDAINRKIHSLRTSFAREKYIIQKCMNSPAEQLNRNRWCFYESMTFLDEFFTPKIWSIQHEHMDHDTTSTSNQADNDEQSLSQDLPRKKRARMRRVKPDPYGDDIAGTAPAADAALTDESTKTAAAGVSAKTLRTPPVVKHLKLSNHQTVVRQPVTSWCAIPNNIVHAVGVVSDSDEIFGQYVAAEIRAITDPKKKRYAKLQIQSIIYNAQS